MHLPALRESGPVAKREDSKKQKYGEICRAYTFVPIVVETSGVFGYEAKAFFRRLGPLSRSKTHDPLSHQKVVQRISVSIQQAVVPFGLFFSWCVVWWSASIILYIYIYIYIYIYLHIQDD